MIKIIVRTAKKTQKGTPKSAKSSRKKNDNAQLKVDIKGVISWIKEFKSSFIINQFSYFNPEL